MEPAMSRQSPYGGVTRPTASVMTTTTPRWTGEMPMVTAVGRITGMKRIIAGIASMKVPTKRKKAITIRRKIRGLPTFAAKKAATPSEAL